MENWQPVLDLRMQLGECPLWHPHESALYWIDIEECAVHRFIPSIQSHACWNMPAKPGAIALDARGGLLVALHIGLAHLHTGNGTLSMLADAPYDQTVMRFNDGRADAAGRFWVGTLYEPRDLPAATLYCVENDNLRNNDHSNKHVTVSNGLAFSSDQKTLYHSDTTAHCIFAHDYDVIQGNITGSRLLRQFSTERNAHYGGRPDGGAVDSEGAYWVAMFEGGCLLRLSPGGDILFQLALPIRCPTMMAFGGDDLRTLYVTTASKNRSAEELARFPLSGCVLSLRVDIPGLPEHFYHTN